MLFRAGVLGLVIVLFTCCAEGQEPSSPHMRVSGDVYAGYTLLSPNYGEKLLGGPAENGPAVGGDLRLVRFVALAFEANWSSVTYGSQLSSSSFTMLGGGRVFFPPEPHARVRLLADALAGATDMTQLTGINPPFTSSVALAVATDGGAEFRMIGPLAVRVEGGYLHSGYKTRYPDTDPQSSIHNQHGRLLIEGVWHF